MKRFIIFFISIMSFAVFACSSDDGKNGSGDPDAGDSDAVLDPICFEPGDGPYDLAFTDVTETVAGGSALTGGAMAVADLNGDNWPDFVITKTGRGRENVEEPAGLYHLLINQAGASFADTTWESGLFTARDGTQGRATTFVLFADVDNDGDKDAFSAVYEDADNYADLEDYTSFFFNDGNGIFTIGPEQEFTNSVVDPLAAASFVDYDRDGMIDVFAGHQYAAYGNLSSTVQDSLFRGNGAGDFDDVTEEVGLTTLTYSAVTSAEGTNHKPTWGVAACDLDNDGWGDLMTSSYGRQLNMLFRNTGGQFEDLTMTSGFASDDNEDFSDNFMYVCYCWAHPDVTACEDAPEPEYNCEGYENSWNVGMDDQPWRLGGNSGVAVCGDVDNDGDMDLLTVELAHSWVGQTSDRTELLINDGFPETAFTRPGNDSTGLARTHGSDWNEGDMSGLMADLDNDGKQDLVVGSSDYPGTAALLWQQQSDGTFVEVAGDVGAQVLRAHGLGLLDYDRDGDYDLLIGTSLMRWYSTDTPPAPDDAYAYLLRNDSGQSANKVMIKLVGSGESGGANKDAVGARISVTAGGETYTREIQGGYGLMGTQQDELMIIGIGAACTVDDVTVTWPNAAGDSVSFADVPANYVMVLEEGQEPAYMSLEDFTD